MMLPLLYFISSLLIIIAAIKSFSRFLRWNGILLITVSVIYACFCFMAYGKRVGIISTISIEHIIVQQGLDPSSLPLPLDLLLNVELCGAILFNILTAIWIWFFGGFWKWCLTVASVFCIIAACAGIPIGISPLYSLFGACCALMASAGWVLGLTYVEFCVIGNIWIPCAAIISTAIFLVYASWRNMRSHSGMASVWPIGTIIFAFLQIIGAMLLLYHYVGTMREAFYRCVQDLKLLAALAHTSYEAINIFLWVFVGTSLLAFNIFIGKCFLKRK